MSLHSEYGILYSLTTPPNVARPNHGKRDGKHQSAIDKKNFLLFLLLMSFLQNHPGSLFSDR